MTHTLTTEWLKERLKNPRTGTEFELISEVLANREALPVAEIRAMPVGNGWKRQAIYWFGKQDCDLPIGTKFYTAPPAPAVPNEMPDAAYAVLSKACGDNACLFADELWNACRAAMLAAAPEGGNG